MHILRRPEIKIENYEAVYDYYRTHKQLKATSWLGYHGMNLLMSPDVTYEDGAQDDIHDHISGGGKVIVQPNHQLNTDQNVVAAIAASEKVLRPLQGHTFVLAKSVILDGKIWTRLAVDTMGALPIWREVDDNDKTDEARLLRAEAAEMAVETSVDRIVERGDHGASFGEATRNTIDVSQLLTFRHGASNIIMSATNRGANVLSLPIAMRYPISDKKIKRHAAVRIGKLVRNAPTTREEATMYTARVQSAVQACLDFTYGKTTE